MKWVTRERPKIDRVACPWLIARFIDAEAEFLFVPPDEVSRVARDLLGSLVTNAIPRDRESEALKARARSAKRFGSSTVSVVTHSRG